MFALESAMDELAEACGIDPVELRIRNEPAVDPETGQPFSQPQPGRLPARRAPARFGWAGRDPRARRPAADGRWLIGTGVAASTYPAAGAGLRRGVPRSPARAGSRYRSPPPTSAPARAPPCWQVAADALGVPGRAVDVRIGDSALPPAMIAGGSMGTASWSWAVVKACRALREQIRARDGAVPPDGLTAQAAIAADIDALPDHARYAFGAQFVEVAVDARHRRGPGPARCSACSRPGGSSTRITARSQFIGGMTMGLSHGAARGER